MKHANSNKKKLADYWIKKLKGLEVVSTGSANMGFAQTLLVNEKELNYFRRLTGRQPVAEFIVILAVYAALIKRYFPNAGDLVYSSDAFEGYEVINFNPVLLSIEHDDTLALKQLIIKIRSEVHKVYDHLMYDADVLQKKVPALEQLTLFGLSSSFRPGKKTTDFQLNCWRGQPSGMQLCVAVRDGFKCKAAAGQFLIDFRNWLINLEEYLHLLPAHIPILPEIEEHSRSRKHNNTEVWDNFIPLPRA